MIATSVLYRDADDTRSVVHPKLPACCTDLNLDQVFNAIVALRPTYELSRVLYQPLTDADDVLYRQDVFKDLRSEKLEKGFLVFSASMASIHRMLSAQESIASLHHKRSWFLEAVLMYCDACEKLMAVLAESALHSAGLCRLRQHLTAYLQSAGYCGCVKEARALKHELSQIHYTVNIKNLTITVSVFENEPDYGKAIEETFLRFSQGEVKNYLVNYSKTGGMNHIEAQVLDRVARLWPDIFERLSVFCETYRDFIDTTLDACSQDIQFYLVWLDVIHKLEHKGYSFCIPEIRSWHSETYAYDLFDIALAQKLDSKTVTNSFMLHGSEHIIVVTGPNQGGKTTFARAFGQIHYLAALGCPVPGTSAALLLPDAIFTHFEREESLATHHGKLYEELLSMHDCLTRVTPKSLLILNEAFSSTTVFDSLLLSERIMKKILALQPLALWVTFLHELADMAPVIVSMAGEIVIENPSMRTFRITRKPANELAYARALAEKHGLTYEQLRKRMGL